MKDLNILSMYAPDNLQVAALKLEIKGMMAKKTESSSESEEKEEEDVDEEELLKFSNLKKIDRTSISIMLPKGGRGRESRVTLLGDMAFEYIAEEDEEPRERMSYYLPPKTLRQKFIEITNEIEEDTQSSEKEEQTPVIKCKANTRSKSILKNRNSQLYINESEPIDNMKGDDKLIEKLQDVDGKMIKAD